MTKIERSKDCGNSPKNQLVEDLAVALALGDRHAVAHLLTTDAFWRIVGGKAFRGREAVLQALEHRDGDSIEKLIILHVVSHGKSGAVDGTIQYRDAERGFCHVFEFGNAKGTSVSAIISYQIDA